MGQEQCLRFIEKHKNDWWKTRAISEKLDSSIGSTTTSLKKLHHSGFIQRKIERGNNYFYKAK